jgi:hypothetical protein
MEDRGAKKSRGPRKPSLRIAVKRGWLRANPAAAMAPTKAEDAA